MLLNLSLNYISKEMKIKGEKKYKSFKELKEENESLYKRLDIKENQIAYDKSKSKEILLLLARELHRYLNSLSDKLKKDQDKLYILLPDGTSSFIYLFSGMKNKRYEIVDYYFSHKYLPDKKKEAKVERYIELS